MGDSELSTRARKIQDELSQRLSKLKARGVKNPLKKLPGYGSQWFYRKRKEQHVTTNDTSPSVLEAPSSEQISQFVKKLKKSNETVEEKKKEEEEEEEIVQGPGFEFPSEKEMAKCNKHWSKKFKNWHPENKPMTVPNTPTSRPFSIRFKAPLPSNEVEVEGRRFRLIENKEEIKELMKNGDGLHKKQVTIADPKFYADIATEYGNAPYIHIFTTEDDPGVSLTDIESKVTAVYAPFPLAGRILTEVKKRLIADGKSQLAEQMKVEVHQPEGHEEDEDDDEVQYPRRTSSVDKTSNVRANQVTPLEDGDEGSVCL